jgi:DNA-binding NarL/FixJ family response regulator
MLLAVATSTRNSTSHTKDVVNVNLIDENLLLTDALMSVSNAGSRVRFSCSAGNLTDGLTLMRRFRPDVVVVSENIFSEGFRSITEELPIRLGETQLAVFADYFSDSLLAHALTARVQGLLSRRCTREQLLLGLEAVAEKKFFVAEAFASRVEIDPTSQLPHVVSRKRLSSLTDRQLEVLVHLAGGETVREIAERMQLSEKAVESHKFRIMNRLGIGNRIQLCRWAIREGLISA